MPRQRGNKEGGNSFYFIPRRGEEKRCDIFITKKIKGEEEKQEISSGHPHIKERGSSPITREKENGGKKKPGFEQNTPPERKGD